MIDWGLAVCKGSASEPGAGQKRPFDDVEEAGSVCTERDVHGPPWDLPDQIRLAFALVYLVSAVKACSGSAAGGSGAAGDQSTARQYLLFGPNGEDFQQKHVQTVSRAMKTLRMDLKCTNTCAQCGQCDVRTARCLGCQREKCVTGCMQNPTSEGTADGWRPGQAAV